MEENTEVGGTRTKEGFHALELELAFFGLRRQWDLEVCAEGSDERVPRHRVLFAESWRTMYVSARHWGCVEGERSCVGAEGGGTSLRK
jgi:hypothetical protein